ncbi:SURF1 family cytochrome oxidase biogenesis protein [Microbacterium azadirachtae]|uniref:SURF1 family cytochrome oxidase biogenesis protein n=1 Tax=Microbacterium azadirachtae TaxID=582680 RepID=UPI00087E2E44|nr:SURF1 family cytochrome oxidase biogenesis protein [Microbacterium azadirachtae]SDL23451.1 Cytochrome oxidase assembly protein ShyY1 [Microbacterium azadirachtae]SEF53337.1 Cytochrome oxidase assembly protein ShyY1 [Microbacterium azadirachtae]SEF53571.1 Cytochrome oxidase assembly protein ShyY1 [Microbacterium azadirachtae]
MMRQRLLRWSAYLAVAIVFAVVCAYLSNWQFSRNDGRQTQLELVQRNYDAKPVALDDLLPAGATLPQSAQWHPVTLHGRYEPDESLLVRNRPHGGTSAFEVLVPFRTDGGRVFIVNRGWVVAGEGSDVPTSIPAPPAGETTVVARLRPNEPLPPSGRGAPSGQVPSINLPLVADKIDGGSAVDTGAYGELVSESPAPSSRPHAFDAPSDDPGPFLSYAIQWILFAIMGFIFIGYVIRTEVVKHRDEAAGRAPRQPRRRRDRDMDDEDALLDAVESR